MRRWWLLLLSALLLLSGGCAVPQEHSFEAVPVVGRWAAEESPAFYFQLYDDGSCIMFDSNNEWVSAGTYADAADHIAFDMDTGSFTWIKGEDGMLFDTGGTVYHYRLQIE